MESFDLLTLAAAEKFETNIVVDKFEKVDGEWTFELKDGSWYPLSNNPEKFLGELIHMLQKTWFTARDAQVLIDWATLKFGWKIHEGDWPHIPCGLRSALENPDNLSANQ